ncbi:hypothetical protein P8452_71701 [Trifolium repens]|nr:hypothetical protein P8452_71701 [Trifolium repens]
MGPRHKTKPNPNITPRDYIFLCNSSTRSSILFDSLSYSGTEKALHANFDFSKLCFRQYRVFAVFSRFGTNPLEGRMQKLFGLERKSQRRVLFGKIFMGLMKRSPICFNNVAKFEGLGNGIVGGSKFSPRGKIV